MTNALFGAGVVLLNIILTFIVAKMRRIGLNRGAGISGWISALIGIMIMSFNKINLGISITVALLMGIITTFAVLAIILPALSPHENLGFFRHISKASIDIGWFIGYIVGIIIGITGG